MTIFGPRIPTYLYAMLAALVLLELSIDSGSFVCPSGFRICPSSLFNCQNTYKFIFLKFIHILDQVTLILQLFFTPRNRYLNYDRIRFQCLETLSSSTSEPDLAEASRFDGLYRAVIALQAAQSVVVGERKRRKRAKQKQADEAEFAALQLLNEIKKQRGRRNEQTQQGRSEAQKDDNLVNKP